MTTETPETPLLDADGWAQTGFGWTHVDGAKIVMGHGQEPWVVSYDRDGVRLLGHVIPPGEEFAKPAALEAVELATYRYETPRKDLILRAARKAALDARMVLAGRAQPEKGDAGRAQCATWLHAVESAIGRVWVSAHMPFHGAVAAADDLALLEQELILSQTLPTGVAPECPDCKEPMVITNPQRAKCACGRVFVGVQH